MNELLTSSAKLNLSSVEVWEGRGSEHKTHIDDYKSFFDQYDGAKSGEIVRCAHTIRSMNVAPDTDTPPPLASFSPSYLSLFRLH